MTSFGTFQNFNLFNIKNHWKNREINFSSHFFYIRPILYNYMVICNCVRNSIRVSIRFMRAKRKSSKAFATRTYLYLSLSLSFLALSVDYRYMLAWLVGVWKLTSLPPGNTAGVVTVRARLQGCCVHFQMARFVRILFAWQGDVQISYNNLFDTKFNFLQRDNE